MTWDDVPPGVLLSEDDNRYNRIKLDDTKRYLWFHSSGQEVRESAGMHGPDKFDGPDKFGWNYDTGFFPVEYLY